MYMEIAKNVCSRLHEITLAARGGITQPRTNFFGHLCRCGVKILRNLAHTIYVSTTLFAS